MADEDDEALEVLRGYSGDDAELTTPILQIVGVTGASVSTMGFLAVETISASDSRAARLDEAQFDLGEGPCWDAVASGRPALGPDLQRDAQWPALADALAGEPIGGVYAFPMSVGSLRMGAIDLYHAEPQQLDDVDFRRAMSIAAILGRRVLRRALAAVSDDASQVDDSPFSRRVVHQATGFVVAQLGVSVADAVLLIQGQSFATGRPVREVAQGILDGRQGFKVRGTMIEDER